MVALENKFWCHSKFDLKTGNELSYIDNKGISYEMEYNGNNIISFKDKNINISQHMLNKLPIEYEDNYEEWFIESCVGLKLKKPLTSTVIYFKSRKLIHYFAYDFRRNRFICNISVLDEFEDNFGKHRFQAINYVHLMCVKHFNLNKNISLTYY